MIRRLALAALFLPSALLAQFQLEYAGRRADLAAKLPPDGVFVAFGGHI